MLFNQLYLCSLFYLGSTSQNESANVLVMAKIINHTYFSNMFLKQLAAGDY